MAIQRFAAAAVLAAAFCLPVVPTAAANLSPYRPLAYDSSAETVHQARGWAASRYDDSYSDYRYAPRERDDRYNDDARWAAPDDRQAEGYPAGPRALGLDRVAQVCVNVVERARDRVDTVEGLARDANGWSVSGSLYDGSGFSCRIGTDGQLQDVHFGRERAPAPLAAPVVPPPPTSLAAPLASGLATSSAPPTLGQADEAVSPVPRQPETLPAANLATPPAAARDNLYRVAKLPPPPAIPGTDAGAVARELPAQPVAPPDLAGQVPSAPEAAAPLAAQPGEAAGGDESALPPADTSEALPVDPNLSLPAVAPGQPKDDGRYSASQAPDFRQPI